MSILLRLILLIFSICLTIIITYIVKKGRMPVKYSMVWYFSALIIILVSLFPIILESFANIIGFETLSNLVIGLIITVLLFITMSLTIIVSGQKKKITLLIQEVSMLKERNK